MKAIFEQRLEGNKGANQAESWGKNIPGKGNSPMHKPRGRGGLECMRKSKPTLGGVLGEGMGLTDQGKDGHLFLGKNTKQEIF